MTESETVKFETISETIPINHTITDNIFLSENEVLKEYNFLSLYEHAFYDKFKSPASENGLAGTLVYIDGTVELVDNLETEQGIMTYTYTLFDNENRWLLLSTSALPAESGITSRAYGFYQGVSGIYDDIPVIFLIRFQTSTLLFNVEMSGIPSYLLYETDNNERLSEFEATAMIEPTLTEEIISSTITAATTKSTTTTTTTLATTVTTTITTPTTPTTTPITEATTTTAINVNKFIVYWGDTGEKMHLKPDCRTITYLNSGTHQEAYEAGRTEGWCGICSRGMNDDNFFKNGNPHVK